MSDDLLAGDRVRSRTAKHLVGTVIHIDPRPGNDGLHFVYVRWDGQPGFVHTVCSDTTNGPVIRTIRGTVAYAHNLERALD